MHLVVLHHGLWGHPAHLDYIESQLVQRYSKPASQSSEAGEPGPSGRPTSCDIPVRVVNLSCNAKLLTYDGIDVCGERAVRYLESRYLGPTIQGGTTPHPSHAEGTDELPPPFDEHEVIPSSCFPQVSKGPASPTHFEAGSTGREAGDGSASVSAENGGQKVVGDDEQQVASALPERAVKISFVGYSMGGCINRYIVGRLWSHGYFDKITPVNFVTFASPHLGAAKPPTSVYNRAFTLIASHYAQRSGRQLMLDDQYHGGRPLLEVMTDDAGPFVKGLQAFQRRSVYANVYYDRTVPYKTAHIALHSAYDEPGMVPVPADSQYPCIVKPAHQSSLAEEGAKPKEVRINRSMLVAMTALTPVWLAYFLAFGLVGWAHTSWRQPQRLAVRDWLEMHGYVLADEREKPSAADQAAAEEIAAELAADMAAELAEEQQQQNGQQGVQEAQPGEDQGQGQQQAQGGVHAAQGGSTWWQQPWRWLGAGSGPSPSASAGSSSDSSSSLRGGVRSSPANWWGDGPKAVLIERMSGALNRLQWEKYDVDTGHMHSHGAIVVRNPQYHTACEDVVTHFLDHLVV